MSNRRIMACWFNGLDPSESGFIEGYDGPFDTTEEAIEFARTQGWGAHAILERWCVWDNGGEGWDTYEIIHPDDE